MLVQIRYPDASTGNPGSGTTYAEVFGHNIFGQRNNFTDRNGSVHQYSYDVLGRMTSDNVVTLGGGVDGSIRRMDYSYDGAGRIYQMTSYSNTNASTIANQIQREYNGFGQLTIGSPAESLHGTPGPRAPPPRRHLATM